MLPIQVGVSIIYGGTLDVHRINTTIFTSDCVVFTGSKSGD